MSYFLVRDEENKTTFDLMQDINDVLVESQIYNIYKFDTILGADPSRGKEIMFATGGAYFSISATHFNNMNPSDTNELNLPVDSDEVIGTGSLVVSCNTSVDLLKHYGDQPTNTGHLGNHMAGACIPANNNFNYSIYKTADNYDFIIKINFNDMNFFVIFGDSSKGTSLSTDFFGYVMGSIRSEGFGRDAGYPINLNERRTQVDNYQMPAHPMWDDVYETNEIMINTIYYISGNLTSYNDIKTDLRTNCGSQQSVYCLNTGLNTNLSNNYTGVDVLVPFEIYLPLNTDDSGRPMKRLREFSFGFCSDKNLENKDLRRIDGKIYEFLHVVKRIDNDANGLHPQQINWGLGIWILRGDLT